MDYKSIILDEVYTACYNYKLFATNYGYDDSRTQLEHAVYLAFLNLCLECGIFEEALKIVWRIDKEEEAC